MPFAEQQALKRRSTASLSRSLAAARRMECECDGYMGFTCRKHDRIRDLEEILCGREGHDWEQIAPNTERCMRCGAIK